MPGFKNRLQAFKKQGCFVSCLQLRKKKYKMRGNPVFEPAAECLDLSLIYQTQQFKGKKKSVKSPLSAATRWHRDVPIPHHQASGPQTSPPTIRKFTFAISSLVLMNLKGGRNHYNRRWRHHPKTTPGCCMHKKGHSWHFLQSHRMVCHCIMKQLSNI